MKNQPYHSFWQRIHNAARHEGFPLRVMFELTYRCNFGCRHCYVPKSYRKYKELNTNEVFSILEQLADIGCFYLGFTGGEPFARRDFIDILWYAKRLGFEVIIYTNGSLIDEEIIDELADLRPNKIDVTIPAMSEASFERITQMPGSYKKVFSAIDLLHRRGIKLGFKSCMLKDNENEIKDIQGFTARLDALHRLDNILSPCLDGSKEPYRYRGESNLPEKTECQIKETYYQISPSNCLALNSEDLFKCGVGVSQAAITPSGELKMCLMIDYPKYKILESSLKDAWEKLKRLVGSIKPDENYQCDRCELSPYCKWCPARSWLYNKSFTSCELENQRRAELLRKNHERDPVQKI
ncbi:radical SAM protein [Candidatus Omnitrophota bacterium]